jgi:hypothetical protein
MSSPRDPDDNLSLEGLADRHGRGPAPLGEGALVSRTAAPGGAQRNFQAAYEALIDAVFTAAGATEWLTGLRRAVAAMLARKGEGQGHPEHPHGIRPSS